MPSDELPQISEIIASLSGERAEVRITGAKGSAAAYLLSRVAGRLKCRFVVVAPSREAEEEFFRELRFFSGDQEILRFPAVDTAPFEAASPLASLTGERLDTLFRLTEGKGRIVVTSVPALARKVLAKAVLGSHSHYLMAGEETDREELLRSLVNLGYAQVPLVEDRGTFSARGGIVDLFPPDHPSPVRVEFFGDFVETIRSFDPATQRSLHPLPELVILPSREVILTDSTVEEALPRLKEQCDRLGITASRRLELQEQLRNAMYPAGIENLQPLLHPELSTLFDYAGAAAVTVLLDPAALEEAEEEAYAEIAAGEARATEDRRIVAPSGDLYVGRTELGELLHRGKTVSFLQLEIGDEGATVRIESRDNSDLKLDLAPDSEQALRPLVNRLNALRSEGWKVIIASHHQAQAQRLSDLLSHYPLPLSVSERDFSAEARHRDGRVTLLIGDISRGFRLPGELLAVVAEEEIFGKRTKRRGISEARKKQILTSLAELKPGDYIVHLDHGIGIYRGLQHLKAAETEGDFLLLEYAGNDRLYLPVDRINLVQRYVGSEGGEPKPDRLGGTAWEKSKAKARQAVEEMAEELLRIYAERQVHEGYAFTPQDDLYREFEGSFGFEETPDQAAAIEDVIRDMEAKKPMDRLICGDVGYGKTEVAMRGAFKAVMDGKQVALLVPTTVLAQQHVETFRERFRAYPVTVEMVSRFRTAKEQKEILERVKKGEVDILIGTHRLLQNDVQFRDLGLLIIDEEQRFGVTHKERLKKFRAVVDILTLTATPIPRTLYMSLMGIRDLSIIDTPPADRLAIRTKVARKSDELIREAVLRELRRGGQVFFVHNRVESIGAMAEHLSSIVPEAKIGIGHGQMEEKALEKVMLGFMHGEFNLLLCTTIIESGLDISNANTLIVDRADTFGLAQLYQLRGRVGRSKQRAYAYLLIPGEGSLTPVARERLKILQEIDELGAGFRIATHDLELRGAGDLLGARQSGNIAAVGFELYTELLEEAIDRLKGGEAPQRVEPEIKLRIPAFIPEDYVREPNQRLVIYKKLTQVAAEEEVGEILEELVDRFGKPPLAVMYLLEVMKIRIALKRFLVSELEFDGASLIFSFHPKTPVSPDTIIGLIRTHPSKYRFSPEFRLYTDLADRTFDGILAAARNVLKSLS
jgi:transcription-repair coupling factor (superfamily II helicase)